MAETPPEPPFVTASAPAEPVLYPWRFGAALGAGWVDGPAPVALIALDARVESRWERPGIFAPSLAVELSAADSAVIGKSSVAGEFQLLAASLELCPARFAPGARWEIRACALGNFGRIRGEGASVDVPEQARSFWAAAGARARLRLQLTDRAFVDGSVGALRTLTTIEYVFGNPDRVIYTTQPITRTAQLLFGLTFL
jgi:hypothetical protein